VKAHAKINLALVVGRARADGKHEVATVLQRIDLADEVSVAAVEDPGAGIDVRSNGMSELFPPDEPAILDNIVVRALQSISDAAAIEPSWKATVEKRVPVAAGLGGGSSDAAAALVLANGVLDVPLPPDRLQELAAALGADVPFFLTAGPQLGTGDGTTLEPLDLRQDYTCVLCLPDGEAKESTAAVYARFDECGRAAGFRERRSRLLDALAANDLAALPVNDLASSPIAAELTALGAFRADVSGAGPTVYGLFDDPDTAAAAGRALSGRGLVWVARPAW
jgi:4-diphosphocytidyl-2-C-methyl-D-erythritol kinase